MKRFSGESPRVLDRCKDAPLSVLQCPSRNPTSSPAPLSYVVNSGMPDLYQPPTGQPMDYQENGVWFDHFTPKIFSPPGQIITTDLAYITKHDGNNSTVLLSESLDAQDWVALPSATSPYSPPVFPQVFPAGGGPGAITVPWYQAIAWQGVLVSPAFLGPQSSPLPPFFNKTTGSLTYTPGYTTVTDLNFDLVARPSSNHPGGFLLTMCGGQVQFVSQDIDYRVYA